MWEEEEQLARKMGYAYPVGVDESGRGPLAGPVIAAAVYIPDGIVIEGVNDCKRLSEKERNALFHTLTTHAEIKIGVGSASSREIDEINILQAALLAMGRAVMNMPIRADYLLVDGNKMPKLKIPGKAIVQGDSRVQAIAAASVIAKVTRDEILKKLDVKYPQYGFSKHKGYGTESHVKALKTYGATEEHRKTFAPVREVLSFGT